MSTLQPRKRRINIMQLKENITGYLFIAPTLLGITVFFAFPIIATIAMSFIDWNFIAGIDKIRFIGFGNFTKLFTDPVFLLSLKNNMLLLISIPVTIVIALALALIINRYVYLKEAFKVMYFVPYISSTIAIAIVYQVLFHPSFGPVNQFLMAIGVEHPPKWLADTTFAIISVIMIQVWISIGFYLIMYLAGLQNIPRDLYEAADIDGATPWQKTWSITVPLLTPTTFFLIITGIIYTFRIFDLIAVLTEGGPANSTSVIVWYLYETAFLNLKTGYAASMGFTLLIIVMLITILQWVSQKKWVNY